MNLLKVLRGLPVTVKEDGLIIEVGNKFIADSVSSKFGLSGYSVNVLANNNRFIIKVYSSKLMDKFLLNKVIAF